MGKHTYAGDIPGIENACDPDFVEKLPQQLALDWWYSTYSWLLGRSACGGEKEPNFYGCKTDSEDSNGVCGAK